MSTPELQSIPSGGEREMIPLSALNQFLFCPRRAALIHVDGIFLDNAHTLRGDIAHEHADLRGYESLRESQISDCKFEIKIWRALPVFSDRLGLNGKCDVVEVVGASPDLKSQISDLKLDRPVDLPDLKSQISNLKSDGSVNLKFQISNLRSLKPVEFKLGKRRKWENDDVQVCAQALCLEEMFGLPVPRGAIFHADSKRRREVEFTPELRARTEAAVAALHALLREFEISNLKSEIPRLPAAVFRPACEECSLFEICLPKATSVDSRAAALARELYQI